MRIAVGTAGINDMQQQIGIDGFFERSLERLNQRMWQIPDKSNCIREHDFGAFELEGQNLFWKIDYYDTGLKYGSPNPEDPRVTRRVLTIMLAEEY